ncbi:Uncharacterised protein [uncultured Collinsella sp.]|nr:Uncharacterised protein [uncultured Collinsella sp.]
MSRCGEADCAPDRLECVAGLFRTFSRSRASSRLEPSRRVDSCDNRGSLRGPLTPAQTTTIGRPRPCSKSTTRSCTSSTSTLPSMCFPSKSSSSRRARRAISWPSTCAAPAPPTTTAAAPLRKRAHSPRSSSATSSANATSSTSRCKSPSFLAASSPAPISRNPPTFSLRISKTKTTSGGSPSCS